jgi:multiple sugar transport system ATP-binding protein
VGKMAKVELKNVLKRFGTTKAVDNINLKVKDKEFLTLLGPSGCGKTTTLRITAGLEKPDKGEIYIGGELVNNVAPKDRDIAMVFQSYALYPHMNVYDNIAFGLKMRKLPKAEIKKRVQEVAEILKIGGLLDRKPNQLSGGQQQRAALGRAIARHPKVFLLDEPLSNLDAILRVHMRVELKKLQEELAVTTIYVTHDQVEAMTMSKRVAIMNEGKLQQLDSPQKIYNKPINAFVGSFVGTPPMNFIDFSLKEKNNDIICDAGYFEFDIPKGLKQLIIDKATNSELKLGVRPEDIFVSETRGQKRIETEVYAVQLMGSHTLVSLKTGQDLIVAQTSNEFKLDEGEKAGITFNMDKIHIFDKKTGTVIV